MRGQGPRMPMRGRRGGGAGMRFQNNIRKTFNPHVPFDMAHCETAFPKVSEDQDDKTLTEALVKRNQELTPTGVDQTSITGLVTKLQNVIDALIVAPDSFEAAVVEEARPVGSYKRGTMMKGSNVADVVIILRTLPTREAVDALSRRVSEDFKALAAVSGEPVTIVSTNKGFDVNNAEAKVKCLIATIPPNIGKLEPNLHLPTKMMVDHLAAIRHVRWFEENAGHVSVKVLIRLIKDLRTRYSGLQCLNTWLIDLLAHHCIMSNPTRTPMAINVAFKRVLSLLASGVFLPGSIGILDPCDMANGRTHVLIPLQQMDILCMTAQTLTRVLAHGGYRQILQLDGATDLVNSVTQWGSVIVTPSLPVYESATAKANGANVGTLDSMEHQQAEQAY